MNDQKGIQDKDKWTKLMFVALVFFGVSTLILGILQVVRNINISPAVSSISGSQSQNAGLNDFTGNQELNDAQLRNQDTDGDGLSDYDEMYIYGTSMYLADTDSDGYNDRQEIEDGFDPNCPKGMDCRGTGNTQSFNSSSDSQQQTSGGELDFNSLPTETQQQFENLSATELRQLLLSSGRVSQEELDKIDDETLMQAFGEVLNQ